MMTKKTKVKTFIPLEAYLATSALIETGQILYVQEVSLKDNKATISMRRVIYLRQVKDRDSGMCQNYDDFMADTTKNIESINFDCLFIQAEINVIRPVA